MEENQKQRGGYLNDINDINLLYIYNKYMSKLFKCCKVPTFIFLTYLFKIL